MFGGVGSSKVVANMLTTHTAQHCAPVMQHCICCSSVVSQTGVVAEDDVSAPNPAAATLGQVSQAQGDEGPGLDCCCRVWFKEGSFW
jgi:hypothetical protein